MAPCQSPAKEQDLQSCNLLKAYWPEYLPARKQIRQDFVVLLWFLFISGMLHPQVYVLPAKLSLGF